MKKFKQIKIEFESNQTKGVIEDKNSSGSDVLEGKIISLTAYMEQKKFESNRIAVHNSLLALANFFPKNTK